jgi:hypothetical protein
MWVDPRIDFESRDVIHGRTRRHIASQGSGRIVSTAPGRGRFQLSPLNQRRWQNFKKNGRGYWSLWMFGILFLLALFAEFIANDKPIHGAA